MRKTVTSFRDLFARKVPAMGQVVPFIKPAPAPLPSASRPPGPPPKRARPAAPAVPVDLPEMRAAMRRERGRCRAILTGAAGKAHPALARTLAFKTSASRGEALDALNKLGQPDTRFAHLGRWNGR